MTSHLRSVPLRGLKGFPTAYLQNMYPLYEPGFWQPPHNPHFFAGILICFVDVGERLYSSGFFLMGETETFSKLIDDWH